MSSRQGSPREQRLEKLAALLGCETRIDRRCLESGVSPGPLARPDRPVAMTADLFVALCGGRPDHDGFERLCEKDAHLLVFGWRADANHAGTLSQVTRGAIADIRPLHGTSCSVPLDGREWTRQLAGSLYERAPSPADAGFSAGLGQPPCLPLLVCGDTATCAAVRIGGRVLFCVGESEIADVDEPASPDFGLERNSQLLPYLIFIRGALGDVCWQSSLQTTRVIVDDPLLKPRYGLLSFDRIFASMDRVDYGLTTAFIPWNYRRTTRKNADYFRSHLADARFSMCAHGCDHTDAEFANRDPAALQHRAALGLGRLALHQAHTGIPFEPIMVFPQGRFSAAAAAALRSTGYHAAINTTVFPVDHDGALTIRDLLAPAVMRFAGFPIFARHYAGDRHSTAALAFDLFLGRPAFIVEHHEFFGDGVPVLESLIQELRRRSPGLQSRPLTEAVTGTCLTRRTGCGSEIRFFTDMFTIDNPGSETVHYTLSKDEPDPDLVDTITVNDRPVIFRRIDGRVAFDADVEPGARIGVSVNVHRTPHPDVTFGRAYPTRVFVRRTLSEFRDEVLGRYPMSSPLAKGSVELAKKSVALFKTVAGGLNSRRGA